MHHSSVQALKHCLDTSLDAVLVALDCAACYLNRSGVISIGAATVDTRDLLKPQAEPLIKSEHLHVIGSTRQFKPGKLPTKFRLGEIELIFDAEVDVRLRDLLRIKDDQHGGYRNVILIIHGGSLELKILKNNGIDISSSV